jgi:hypothetical protein
MKLKTISLILVLSGLSLSCKSSDSGTNPTPTPAPEDWTFPANAVKFAVTAYTEKQSVAVGEAFDVKLVLYNISDAFGTAIEMTYASDKVDVLDLLSGPFFAPDSSLIGIKEVTASANRISYGVTYKAGSNKTSNGSGVVFKLKCRGKASGSAPFIMNAQKLEVRKSDGNLIANFGSLSREDLTVVVQ